MKKNLRLIVFPVFMFLICSNNLHAQKLVESVAGIVGNEVIYLSDVENNIAQARASGDKAPLEKLRCRMFEDLLVSKLFLDQARIDSVIVTESSVEGEINVRLNDYIKRAGSEKALEEYFKKSMIEIKMDLKKSLLNQRDNQ